ncbi:MAG: helix-turn-helix domain-containing protein [Planctomycetota bacterium]
MDVSQAQEVLVLNTEQIRAISSAERLRVYEAVNSLNPASATDIADVLGAKAKSLYYHIHALVECGLLLQVGSRRVGRRDEALFAPTAQQLRITPVASDPEYLAAVADLGAAALRRAERLHRRAVTDGNIVLSGVKRQRGVMTEDIWLTPASLEQLNRKVEHLFQEAADESVRSEDADLYTLTMAFSPAYRQER